MQVFFEKSGVIAWIKEDVCHEIAFVGTVAALVIYKFKDFSAAVRLQQTLQIIFSLPNIAEFHLLGKILTRIEVSRFCQNQVQFAGIAG